MTGTADSGCAAGGAVAGRSGPAAAGMCQGRRGRRNRVPAAAITRSGRTRTVSAGSATRARRPAGGASSAKTDVDPAGVLLGARRFGPGCADPRQDQAVPTAEIGQCRVGASCGQHDGASGQDGVQPDWRAVAGGDQRVGDQAAGPQRGGNAGREEAPRGWLQGAGLELRGGRGAHGLADAVAADRGGQGDPAEAEARSCPPVIPQPTRTAFFTRALAWGRRSTS